MYRVRGAEHATSSLRRLPYTKSHALAPQPRASAHSKRALSGESHTDSIAPRPPAAAASPAAKGDRGGSKSVTGALPGPPPPPPRAAARPRSTSYDSRRNVSPAMQPRTGGTQAATSDSCTDTHTRW